MGKKEKGRIGLKGCKNQRYPNVFVVVPLHDDHPPIMDLNVFQTLHPLSLLKQLGHLIFLLVPPTFSWVLFGHFGPFLLTPTHEYCPPFGCQNGSANFFHFLTKWPKEYDMILAFIHEVNFRKTHFWFPFNLIHLLSFNFYIYLIMCKSIIPRKKLVLFLPIFLETFRFLWRGWLVHEHKA